MQSGSTLSQECVNEDIVMVHFLKNKNKSVGAGQAGSGQGRLIQIPVPDQGKHRAGQRRSKLP
jgi:hypothetical protein